MSDDNVIQLAGKFATVKRADRLATAMVAADNRKGWQVLDRAGIMALPDPVPLVEGWLQLDSVNWLAGPPQSGKSFVALDLAASVAAGIPWQGRQVTQASVLYVVAESPSGFKVRIRAWEMLHNRELAGVTFVNGAPQLTSDEDVTLLSQWAGYVGAGLIVIDTQARCTTGVDENSAQAMSTVIDSLDRLRRGGGAAVLSVHHTPRNANNLRGSVSQEGAATTIITVEKDGVNLTVSADARKGGKQKDIEPADDLSLLMAPYGPSVALVQGMASLTGAARILLGILAGREGGTSKSDLLRSAKAEGVSESTVHRTVKRMVDGWLVSQDAKGPYVYYQLTSLGISAAQGKD